MENSKKRLKYALQSTAVEPQLKGKRVKVLQRTGNPTDDWTGVIQWEHRPGTLVGVKDDVSKKVLTRNKKDLQLL